MLPTRGLPAAGLKTNTNAMKDMTEEINTPKNANSGQDLLHDELSRAASKLEARQMAMLKDGIYIVKDEILQFIEPLSVQEVQSCKKNDDLISLAAKHIVKACKGRLLVPHLTLPIDKTSPVWVWNGMFWDEIPDIQIFYDFVGDACQKLGIGEETADNPKFSKPLYKTIEKKISRYPRKRYTEDVVLVPLLNGVLEIDRTGQRTIRPHRREDYLRYVLPYEYDEQAQCPRFKRYLDEVLPDATVHQPLLEYMAYPLVPWLHIEKIMAFLGSGANGKSVLIRIIEGLYGKRNLAHENLHDLTYDEVHRANIEDKLFNVCQENEGRIKGSVLRTMVSGETITVKKLYSQPYETDNYAKLLFSFNEMPQVKSIEANMRRWMLVKFDRHFSDEEADTDLSETLARELPGILNLLLSVLPGLMERKKFTKSEAIDRAVMEMEFDNDPVLQFLTLRCDAKPEYQTKASELFKAFGEFCQQSNIAYDLKNQGFYKRLEALGHKPFMDNNQKMFHIRVVRYED